MFVAWQIAGTPTFWFPPSQKIEISGGEVVEVPPEIIGYCKTCYNKIVNVVINATKYEECPDFW